MVAEDDIAVDGVAISALGTMAGDPNAKIAADAETDATGNFEFTSVPAGTYELRMFTKQGNPVLASDIVVQAGARVDGLEVRMR